MHSPQAQPKASILIVDDSPDAHRLLTLLLRPEGHRLLIARDGQEALRIAQQVPELALVLLDVMMPGIDGLEVCRRLRSRTAPGYLPIILATALTDEAHVVEGLAAGADDYVTKPIHRTEVLARVRAALRLKQATDELLEARELAAIGAMAVTLGHEINNPLTIVLGNLELVLRSPGMQNTTRAKLQAALDSANRIRDLVKRLVRVDKIVTTSYLGIVDMLDLARSCPPEEPHSASSALDSTLADAPNDC